MSIDLNEHQPAADETQRRGHMAALAVAEQIVTISPIVPTGVTVTCSAGAPDRPRVEAHFYHSPEGVEQLAEVLGATVTTRPHQQSDPRPFTSAELVVSGVPVLAWSLAAPVAAQDAAVAA
ncbi:hypothetical protein V2J94_41675 [Streptomyces sp. DSM 41524]|uniref:Uncharacterized protein n=1 Tax=Streptomyces asiaticus subsp. ignotus TaxID=3098222 RepID=A0ABU7QA74_9ACTN|nr:hypothetical protein [Streptomyces sp. DSM 41524]